MQLLLGKNPTAKLKLKENKVKGDVRIVSKTSLSSSFSINGNTLDMAEEEDKHGKQEEDPCLLWVFVPLRNQTEHTQCRLRRNCNLSTPCSFSVTKKDALTSLTQTCPFRGGYHRLSHSAMNCKPVS